MPNGIHIGANTHIHFHAITWHSLRMMNVSSKSETKLMPLEDLLSAIVFRI